MDTLSLTPEDAAMVIVERARALPGRRVVVGIAGGPGVGKSTITAEVVARLGAEAAYVPMDGFHMRHAKLEGMGTVADKGAPHTFEAAAYAAFLARLRETGEDVTGPAYSRAIEDVVDDGVVVPGAARILVTEGNYLLLDEGAWAAVRALLDLAVFVRLDRAIVRQRLLARHAEHGLFSQERNRAHVDRVDLANYDLVQRSAERADLVIDLASER